jgi:hypothetical protein
MRFWGMAIIVLAGVLQLDAAAAQSRAALMKRDDAL